MNEIILKYVLKNQYEYGTVNPKAVLGMVLREKPELKKDVPLVLKEIEAVTAKNSSLSKKEIKSRLEKIDSSLLVPKKDHKKRGPLKELPNAEVGKVVVRMAPSPSGALHIGHAYGASLNYEYAKMYKGKFILRIEDTNPSNIYEPAYDLTQNDAKWLTEDHIDEVFLQSDRFGIYYDYAEKLVQMGKAYVCSCNPDEFRELKRDKKECPCRNVTIKEQQILYAKMFGEFAEGEVILRLKTNIKDKNPAMRDFGIMRINEHIHPRTKTEHRVWPLMVFSVAIDDHEMGLTHVLNGKDQADNAKKESIIMEYLGWTPPVYKHWGFINFTDLHISKTKTKLAIEQGEFTGWDDIRLPYLAALRRRGYQSGAFRKYAIEVGMSLNDKTVTQKEFWKMVNAFNKDIVEEKANRYFMIEDPVEIEIEGAPLDKVKIDLHPNIKKRGTRTISPTTKLFVEKADFKKLAEGKIHRLMDYCNFEVKDTNFVFLSTNYEDYKNAHAKGHIIHWLPTKNTKVELMKPNGKKMDVIAESAIEKVKVNDIVQFERKFFARCDAEGFWYLHT